MLTNTSPIAMQRRVPRLGDKAVLPSVLMKMDQRTVRKAVFMHVFAMQGGIDSRKLGDSVHTTARPSTHNSGRE
jgi:hypothetical protein